MKESIEAMLWDFIVDNNIATEDEVRLGTDELDSYYCLDEEEDNKEEEEDEEE